MRFSRYPLPGLRLAENVFMRLLPRKAHRGSTWFGRTGDLVQQPQAWAGLAGMLAVVGGPRGRRAAVRGSVCYGATAVLTNLVIKPVVGRSRPPGSGEGRTGPITSSFPSGHAATDLSFTLGVAQEIPALFFPLALATSAAHWSLVRSRGHYPTDVFAGGFVGVAVALVIWRAFPPQGRRTTDDTRPQPGGEIEGLLSDQPMTGSWSLSPHALGHQE
ncbi:MAG: phosphatase PAP2 family protein [Actinomycetota bacterium]|nr:phosphatase PAP2 family protein [Actinomycetota bacterium]